MEDLNKIIAKNMVEYRKRANITQSELAARINYSDKSISKWERGEGVPDIHILKQLADFYDITVNDFLKPGKPRRIRSANKRLKLTIALLAIGLVFFIATLTYAAFRIFVPALTEVAWLTFIAALPVAALISMILCWVWKNTILTFVSASVVLWTLSLCLFLTVPVLGVWFSFLPAVALQIILILLMLFKKFHAAKPFRKP